MKLTQKETSLLKDLKMAEEVCIEKYGRYADDAKDPCLKNLFTSILQIEQGHLNTIGKIMKGESVKPSASKKSPKTAPECTAKPVSAKDKKFDAYLCQDALAMEKHVSGVYDTSIFEFNDPTLRDVLNGIQKEEQNHGKMIYDYLSTNGLANIAV